MDGLADGAAAPATGAPAERWTLQPRLLALLDRARAWLRRVGAGRPPTAALAPDARLLRSPRPTRPSRRRSA